MSGNKKHLIILLLFIGVGLVFSLCKNTPSKVNYNKIIYHHSFELQGTDLDRLDKNLILLNNLCSKLELPYTFTKSFQKFSRSKEEYIRDLRFDEGSIHVFLNSEKKRFSGASHSRKTRTIEIARNDWLNPALLLHEIFHFISGESSHATETKVGKCMLPKSNGCMNLMSGNYYTPFNFLLTNIQHQKYSQEKITSNCGDGHVFPKDLIANKIEDNIACCLDIDYSAGKVQNWLNKNPDKTNSSLEIMAAIKAFNMANLCPIDLNLNSDDYSNLDAISGSFRAIEALADSLPNGFPQLAVIFGNSRQDLYCNAVNISYELFLEQYKPVFLNEAKYLSDGTSIPATYVYNSRMNQVEFHFRKLQESLDSISIYNQN